MDIYSEVIETLNTATMLYTGGRKSYFSDLKPWDFISKGHIIKIAELMQGEEAMQAGKIKHGCAGRCQNKG